MKRIYYYMLLIFTIIISSAFQCDTESGCQNGDNYFQIEKTPIKVNMKNDLKVNDTIWLSVSIKNKNKTISGKEIDLKLDETYGINFTLFTNLKNSFNEFSSLNFGNFYVEKTGKINTDNGHLSSSLIFDDTTNSYNANFGLILKEKGTYQIRSSSFYNSTFNNDGCPLVSYEIPIIFKDANSSDETIFSFSVE